jgi:CheY-like chemotaxis protein
MSSITFHRSLNYKPLATGKKDWSMVGHEKFRVVAFDDDQDILQLIGMSLGDHYDVVTVSDPLKAAEVLEIIEPEVVILDVMMPKVTGYQIAEVIRSTPKLQHILIMFLSAKDTPRDMKYGYKLGANFYLTKPFQPERLLRTLAAMVEEHYPSHRPRPKATPIEVARGRLAGLRGPAAQWHAHQAQQLLGEPKKVEDTRSSSGRLPKAQAGNSPAGSGASDQPRQPSILPPEDPDSEGSGLGRKNWVG